MIYHPSFFTATILNWQKLLKPDKYKQIIVNSLMFLVNEMRINVYGFVIMDNHIHLIWQIIGNNKKEAVQLTFLRYTAQKIKQDLVLHHPLVLDRFRVNAKDRVYQFWERNALSIELSNDEILIQKLDYIHDNPFRAGLCRFPEEYRNSSYCFYYGGKSEFSFLKHYND